MKSKFFFFSILGVGILVSSAHAQLLGTIAVTPVQAKVGEAVTVTANIDVINGNYCGFVIGFGDGNSSDGVSDIDNKTPLVIAHTYTKPGPYHVTLGGRNVQNHPNCGGQERAVDVIVIGVDKSNTGAMLDKTTGANKCPTNWTLVSKMLNKKTGAFACAAKPGTALPEMKPACSGDLTYYENAKKGQLGCRP